MVILCGGRGTRLREKTVSMPKALVEIGGIPVLRHVIDIYLRQGFREILLATGYRGEMVAEFARSSRWPEGVAVEAIDTGVETATGGRIAALAPRLGDSTFCVTYADGVADIDLDGLLDRHRAAGSAATVTLVQPDLPWGVAELDAEGNVSRFVEKPRSGHWVNGGFFCFEPDLLARLDEHSVLEREPLESLAADGELCAYRHEGFWHCMDTYKDAVVLNDLWRAGQAPWTKPRARMAVK